MIWTPKPKPLWRRKFAWFPVRIADQRIWLCRYWIRRLWWKKIPHPTLDACHEIAELFVYRNIASMRLTQFGEGCRLAVMHNTLNLSEGYDLHCQFPTVTELQGSAL